MQYRIEGMDCASCVGKIETALTRMPGVSDIRLNFATEKLERLRRAILSFSVVIRLLS